MRKALLFTILIMSVISIQAQISKDSLCRMIDFTDKRFTGYIEELIGFHNFGYARKSDLDFNYLNSRLDYRIDSIKPLNRIYSNEKIPLNGWCRFSMYGNFIMGQPHVIGIDTWFSNIFGKQELIFNIIGCFNNGVPCCTWRTAITWMKKSQNDPKIPEEVFVDQTFKDGLLDGVFRVLHKEKEVYRTIFVDGSGYYKAYLPNGRLYSQGEIIKGLPNGTWTYFSYDKNGQRNKIEIMD